MDTTERTSTPAGTPYTEVPYSGSDYTAPVGDPVAALPPATPGRRFSLRRSRTDSMLGGVCGGLADETNIDPALLRIGMVALTLISGGGAALVYLIAWILIPAAETSR